MTVFGKSTYDMYFNDGEQIDCEVRISDEKIIVSYRWGGKFVVYEGKEVGPGHFKLASNSVNGRATLHRFESENILEGWWSEGGQEGMWRFFLETHEDHEA